MHSLATMHHPEISGIANILDDYFLIFEPTSFTRVEGRKQNGGHEDSLVVSRKLKNGYIEIIIQGENEDDDDVQIYYYLNGSKNDWDRQARIEGCEFSLDSVRKAVREIVRFDSKADKSKSQQSLCSPWTEE